VALGNLSTTRSTPAGTQHAQVDLEVYTAGDDDITDTEQHTFLVINP
jgi:hypothetical protein